MSSGDVQDLVKLTEWEIKLMDDARREQGWSPWVLFVALAGLAWKLGDEIGQQHAWAHVGLYWAAFTLIASFVVDGLQVLMAESQGGAAPAAPRYFSTGRLLGGTRPYLLFSALKISGAALLVLTSSALAGWLAWLWAALFGVHLAGLLIALWATFLDVPFSPSVERAHSALRAGGGFARALYLLAMFLMLRQLWPVLSAPFSAADLKLAFVAFAASEIVSLLLERHIANPIRDNLVQLRRAIGLGEIGYDDGRKRLDLTLHGAEMSAYLRPRVQALLTILNEITKGHEALRLAEVALVGGSTGEAEQAITADKAKKLERSLTRLVGQADQALAAFDFRVGVMAAFDAEAREGVRSLREDIARQLTEAKGKLARAGGMPDRPAQPARDAVI